MMMLLLGLAAAFPEALLGQANTTHRFVQGAGSSLRVEGTTPVGPFRCESQTLLGHATVESATPPDSLRFTDEALVLAAEADTFTCRPALAERDLRRMLRMPSGHDVHFSLRRADVHFHPPRHEGWHPIALTGDLRLAGVTRSVSLSARIMRLDAGRYELEGEVAIRLSDFGLRPPSVLFGLVHARDDVKVSFDVLAVPVYADSSSAAPASPTGDPP